MRSLRVIAKGWACTLVLSLLFPALFAAETADTDVRVLRSTVQSLVFEYTPRFSPMEKILRGQQEFRAADFAGAIPSITESTVGTPDLRFRFLPLGFPGDQGNAVQVIAADYEDIPDITLAPVPGRRIRDEMVEAVTYEMKSSAYAVNSFVPEQAVELAPVGRSRTMFLGGVKVYPLQYNPATRTLRKYRRIVVEVVFGSPVGVPVRNDDDQMFRGHLLNYAVAREWKFEPPGWSPGRISNSVLAQGDWYRLSVTDEGIYMLSAQYLASAGINLGTLDPRTIKMYGHGGLEVPESIIATRPEDLQEIAIHVEGEGDGRFDGSDYILFYGRSTRNLRFNQGTRLHEHTINRYTETNYYWLTHGGTNGLRMQDQPSEQQAPVIVPDRFRDVVSVEEEKVNLLSSGKDWFGQSLNPGGTSTQTNPLPGLVANDRITYRYALVARSSAPPQFEVQQAGRLIGTHALGTVFYASEYDYADRRIFTVSDTSNLGGTSSQLSFTFRSANIAASGWIDWVEIHYPRAYAAVNNYLRFRSPDQAGVVEYQLSQFTQSPVVLNVTAPADVRRVSGVGGTYSFRAAEPGSTPTEYCAASSSAFRTPAGITRMSNQNLRGYADGADFIIVTSQEYRPAADRLKALREQAAHGGLRTIVVDVDQIYNEFSGGLPDVTAIRDYLKYTYDNWTPRPRFVLFFGGASYDYKGILGSRSSFVPTWQNDNSIHGVNSYSTDDYFAKFTPGSDRISLTIGRISSRTVSEAHTVVDKLQRYDNSSARDFWKMRTLFVGDDAWTPEGGEIGDGVIHSQDAETLARTYTPDEFEKWKIYIAEYPTVITAQGRRKPGAYQDIIDRINQGVLLLAYAGHGNPTVWAHESIFSVQTSIPQLVNADRLSVFLLATCNFSQFDDPKRYTGSELLLNKPDGGAIGAISATRRVFASSNARFSQDMFRYTFSRDAFGRLQVERPATAIYLVKSLGFNDFNDQKFCYLGDPTMKLQYPSAYARIDSINTEPVDSVNGGPRSVPIEMKALSRITVTGTVRDQANRVDSTFTGTASIVVNDASREVVIVNFYPNRNWPYITSGGTIFRGVHSIRNGRFTATFVVPKDIAYADTSGRGRLVVSFYGDQVSGAGYTGRFRVGGTDTTAGNDTEGPEIAIFLDSRGFRAGDLVGESPTLYVDLRDSNGINTSGTGIGHRIEGWLNTSTQGIDLTEFYTGKLDSYQEGTVEYRLRGLPGGRNTLRVRAWDTYNNASTAETHFEVTGSDQLTIADVFNYPNPFARGTSFTFRQNQLTPLTVNVKIYTLAGRLIQTLDAFSPGEQFVQVPWDGRDRDGDVLANGVYLYKLIVKTVDGRFTSEVLGKLSVLK